MLFLQLRDNLFRILSAETLAHVRGPILGH